MNLTMENNDGSNLLEIKFTRQEGTIELKHTGLINKKSSKQLAGKIQNRNPF